MKTVFRSLFRNKFIPADYKFDFYKPVESLKRVNLTIALYNIAGFIATQLCLNYIASSFVLLSVEHTLYVWRETYGGIVLPGIALYFILKFIAPSTTIEKKIQ